MGFGYRFTDGKLKMKSTIEWIPVENKKPKTLHPVLCCGFNQYRHSQIAIAKYIPPKTILSDDFLDDVDYTSDCEEYDENKGCYWVVEGWWMCLEKTENIYKINLNITHWSDLPQVNLSFF